MNKNDFIDILEKNLLRLPKADRDDILSDYEAHFALGAEAGKSEEEVSASLGDPNELAQIYLENLPEGSKGAPVIIDNDEPHNDDPQPENSESAAHTYNAATYSDTGSNYTSAAASTEKKSPDAGAIVGVVFLSIAALCLLGFIAEIWFGIAGASIGCFAAAVALVGIGISLVSESVLACVGGVLLAVALVALGILFIVGCIASVHGIIYLVKKFIMLCKNILNGGNQ